MAVNYKMKEFRANRLEKCNSLLKFHISIKEQVVLNFVKLCRKAPQIV